jgi:pilus assembly protein CpaF
MKDNMSSAFSGNISEVESVLATSNILVTNVTNDVGILSCFNDVLRKIMEEEDVNEVMINGIKNIYIERDGVVCELGSSVSDDEISRFIDSVSLFNSRNIDINHPIFDGKIPGGFRCNVVIRPVSLDGAIITLRKHRPSLGNFDLLLDNATLSSDMVEFLVDAVKEKKK